jgi:hypothetical protein
MKRLLSGFAFAIVALGAVASHPANAAVVSLSEGGNSDPSAGFVSSAGPVTISFDGGSGPLVANTGSVFYTSSTTPGVAAAPFGDTTGYASIGSTALPQSATLSLGAGVNYLGFYWGSVDSFNTLQLFDGTALVATYTGSDILNPANGFQGSTGSAFVNFSTNGTDKITSAVFTSTQAAFEIDSITTAVPEPSTWALLMIGFAGLGFLGYRRSNRGSFRFA